jgi:polyisoprenoid-binding protein YceI
MTATPTHSTVSIPSTAGTSISRSDFGVSFGVAADGAKVFVGDEVDVHLDIQAALGE